MTRQEVFVEVYNIANKGHENGIDILRRLSNRLQDEGLLNPIDNVLIGNAIMTNATVDMALNLIKGYAEFPEELKG